MGYALPTEPMKKILDRELSVTGNKELIDLASPLLQEIINYSTAAFGRCSGSSKGQMDVDIAILALFLHIIEMTDGIEVLISKSCCAPSIPLLRSIFEALLSIEYILEKNYALRAYSWNYNYICNRLKLYKLLDKNTPQGKEYASELNKDKSLKSLKFDELPNPKEPIANLTSLLAKDPYKKIDDESKKFKSRYNRKPKWYELFDTPKTLQKLASDLNRGGQYLFLYRDWSSITHAGDLSRFLTKGAAGDPALKSLRNASELANVVTFTATFLLSALRLLLGKFRPEENIGQWYIGNVRNSYRLISSRSNIEIINIEI